MMKPVFDLQPMTLGDILDRTIRLYRRDFLHNLGIACVPYVLLVPFWAFLSVPGAGSGDPRALFTAGTIIPIALMGLLGGAAYLASMGAMTRSVSERYLGGAPSLWDAYAPVIRRVPSLLWAFILLGAVAAGLAIPVALLAIPLAFVLGPLAMATPLAVVVLMGVVIVRFLLIAQAVIIEDVRGTAALKRSWALTRGIFWRTIVLLVFVGVVGFILQLGFQLAGGFLTLGSAGRGALLLAQALNAAAQVLVMPIGTIAFTLLYYDSRIKQEGFDLEVMAQNLGMPSAPAAGMARNAGDLAPTGTPGGLADVLPPAPPAPPAGPSRSPAAAPPRSATGTPARPTGTPPDFRKTCPQCGVQFPPVNASCPKCGTRVSYRPGS
jgi:hypothetical protein